MKRATIFEDEIINNKTFEHASLIFLNLGVGDAWSHFYTNIVAYCQQNRYVRFAI